MLAGQKLAQIAYFVPDVRAAAAHHSRMFGSGPFYVADDVDPPFVRHRGEMTSWRHTSAFGQWGELMVEFLQQDHPAPSILHDVYPAGSGRYGVHHIAFIVDDPDAVAADFERRGHPVALDVRLTNGIRALMIDTIAANGHVVEVYAPTPALVEIYDFIRNAALGFDGGDPVRTFQFG